LKTIHKSVDYAGATIAMKCNCKKYSTSAGNVILSAMGDQHHVAAVICLKIISAKFRGAFYVKKIILQEKPFILNHFKFT